MMHFYQRHFLRLSDFTQEEIGHLLRGVKRLKNAGLPHFAQSALYNKKILLLFEKELSSIRQSVELATRELGAAIVSVDSSNSHLSSSSYDGIFYCGNHHQRLIDLAQSAGSVVWNGLSEQAHPIQILADLLTMHEQFPAHEFHQIKLAYLGNADTNMANSLLVGAVLMGMDIRLVAPKACWTNKNLVDTCSVLARKSGAKFLLTEDVIQGVNGVDFLYTDRWASLDESCDVWTERIALLKPYQINRNVVELTGNPAVKFLQSVPIFHDGAFTLGQSMTSHFGLEKGVEVTKEVFASKNSLILAQFENYIHAMKFIMMATLFEQPAV